MLSDIAWKVIIKELHNDNIHSVSKWGSSDKKIYMCALKLLNLFFSTNSLMHASMSCNCSAVFAVFIGFLIKSIFIYSNILLHI